ncbi:hypothetical protein [Haladaptatus sp. DYF46]|uniref:hypothetical protein n=1 Tax=Haladaptatus sp. DYF46 TaxID=2886041 RepID=UPI001E4439B1|nr:hypothetical protein [Haladaptatus sp. DYF46]
MAFEYGNKDYDQRKTIPNGTEVEDHGVIYVHTGAGSGEFDDTAGYNEISFDYDNEVVANDGSDVIALLSPDESGVLCRFDENRATSTTTSEDTTTSEETTTTSEETTTTESTDTTTTDENSESDDTGSDDPGGSDDADESDGSGSSDDSSESNTDDNSTDSSDDGC